MPIFTQIQVQKQTQAAVTGWKPSHIMSWDYYHLIRHGHCRYHHPGGYSSIAWKKYPPKGALKPPPPPPKVFHLQFIYYLSHGHFFLGGDSLSHLMLITGFVKLWSEGHQKLGNEVGSVSPSELLVGFKQGTSWFLSYWFIPQDHSPFIN